MWGGVCVRSDGVRVRLQQCAYVVSCRPGGLGEELAVDRWGRENFADACSYLVYLLVGVGKRVFQGWAQAHAPEDPVDCVVLAGEGLLWGGGTSVCAGLL